MTNMFFSGGASAGPSGLISIASGNAGMPVTWNASAFADHMFIQRMLGNLPVGSDLWNDAKELGMFRRYGIIFPEPTKEEKTDGS